MLYAVAQPDISILTHPYNPMAELNGFKQVGDKTPVTVNPEPPALGSWFSYRVRKIFGHVHHSSSAPAPYPVYHALGDPGLGSMFSKAAHSVSKAYHSVKANPIKFVTTVGAKLSTGGITLITDTGVLGKDAKKIGKKVDTVAAGAVGGGITGFVTSGFNPYGAIVGAAAGGAKGLDEATKTSKSGDIVKAGYQGAAYGAAAGVATAAVQYGYAAHESAAVAKEAAAAQQAGYGAAQSTAIDAGTYVPGAATTSSPGFFATTAKVAGDIGKTAAGTILTAAVLRGGGSPGQPGGGDNSYQPPLINIPGLFPAPVSGAVEGPANPYGIPQPTGGSTTALPDGSTASVPESLLSTKNIVMASGGLLLLTFMLRRPKMSYRRAA